MDKEKTNEVAEDTSKMSNQDLKDAVSQTIEKIRNQSLLLGAQTMCSVILQKIMEFESKPGRHTLNDHKRLVKDIKEFCQTGISRKVNADGTTSEREQSESVDSKTEE